MFPPSQVHPLTAIPFVFSYGKSNRGGWGDPPQRAARGRFTLISPRTTNRALLGGNPPKPPG